MSVCRLMIQGHVEPHTKVTEWAKRPWTGRLLKSGWCLSGMGSGQYRKAGNKWVHSRKWGFSDGRKQHWYVQKAAFYGGKESQQNVKLIPSNSTFIFLYKSRCESNLF